MLQLKAITFLAQLSNVCISIENFFVIFLSRVRRTNLRECMNDKSSKCTARNVRSQLQFLSKAKADHWQSIAKLAITSLR